MQPDLKMKTMADFDALLFDLDGTLLDTAPDLIAACNAALQHFNLKALPDSLVRTKVTSGMRAMLKLGIAPEDLPKYDIDGAMRDYFAACYLEHIDVYTVPFPGISDLCAKALEQNLKLAVITNKYENMTLKLLNKAGMADWFEVILGCDSTPYAKPDPRPLTIALERLQVPAKRALYIGDHLNDIKAAKAAGVKVVAAAWGYGGLECGPMERWGADFLAKDPFELQKIIFTNSDAK